MADARRRDGPENPFREEYGERPLQPSLMKDTVIHTGYINWPRSGELGWTHVRQGTTYVWAYWLVDRKAQGMDLFEENHPGRDWFLASEDANISGPPLTVEHEYPSPNHRQVEEAAGLLASVCLGTCDGTYRSHDGYFWAGHNDVSRTGRLILSHLSTLYARDPVLITYMNVRPMRQPVPGAALDQATVVAVSGS